MIEKMRKRIAGFARGWIGSLIIAFLLATSIKSAIADWYVVPTGSMKPTIIEGDRIFVNKLAYDLKIPYTTRHISVWNHPGRGDIVVFYSPNDSKRLVKRVVGLPGDILTMEDNRLYINGKPVSYNPEDPRDSDEAVNLKPNQQIFEEIFPQNTHDIMITFHQPSMSSFPPISVPEGHYFMLGDNRDNSADSRYYGYIERRTIVGRATSIVMSLDPEQSYRPRWERFFSALN